MSTDNPNLIIDDKNVAIVDAKIRETQALTRGVMSSWENPLEGVHEGPMGRVTVPKKDLEIQNVRASLSSQPFVTVPTQAIKEFKRLIPLFGEVKVLLTDEQKRVFLDSLQSMPTPKMMSDAKAIFTLMEALSK